MMSLIKNTLSKLITNKAIDAQIQDLTAQVNAINKVMGVIEFTPDGNIIKVNHNFLMVVGYTENEVLGQHHRMFVEPAYAESPEYKRFWEKLARGEFDQGQYKRLTKGDREVWLEASYNPVFDANGKVVKVVKFATDISTQKNKDIDTQGQLNAINKSQGTIELGLDGKVITANQIFLDVLGYSLQEAIGQHHSGFVSPEYAKSQEYKDFWDKLKHGEFVSGRFQRVGKGGKNIWLEASYNPIFDANGKPYKVVKFAADITKQVNLEQEAKNLAIVTYETENSVLITDKNGLIEFVNPSFTKLTGYTFEECKGKKPGDFLQGKLTDLDTVKRIHTKLEEKQPFTEEIINYNKKGDNYWISLSVNPVFDDKDNLDKFVSIQTDITESKTKQLELNMRLEAISRSTSIIEFTPNGNVTFANQNFCQTTGYSLDDLKGKHHSLLVEPAYKSSSAYKAFWDKLNRGEYDAGIYKRIAKNGHEIWLQASYNPIVNDEGQVIKIIKFATDITTQYSTSQAVEQAVEETKSVIDGAKSGDLTSRVSLDGKTGAIASLCDGINALMDKMTEVIAQVREAGETINTAASEIATGNNDLSSRTEQQASSLEETASSMEELASTVKQNAENAKQANQLAAAASGVAVKGGEVVSQVVNTMSAINGSAKKIEDIISVIDGIAFQTNILALNAAVEAARAGEQGRGFAVVAGEVRNLAQRSASAAKEIKELITDSVSKTAEGTTQVEQAGKTMQEIVSSVQRVTDIMGEISAASNEQSEGIDQVNNAITSMDEVTQQNAALVEEAAAAAESLVEQAASLMDTVGAFRLAGGNTYANQTSSRSVKPSSSFERRASSSPMRANTAKPTIKTSKPNVIRALERTGTDDNEWEEF